MTFPSPTIACGEGFLLRLWEFLLRLRDRARDLRSVADGRRTEERNRPFIRSIYEHVIKGLGPGPHDPGKEIYV